MFFLRSPRAYSVAFASVLLALTACGPAVSEKGPERNTVQNNTAPMRPIEGIDAVPPELEETTGGKTGPTGGVMATPAPAPGTPVKTTVRVHYPNAAQITLQTGTGKIMLRGSEAPLSWTQSMTGAAQGDLATFEVDAPYGTTIEFKPVIEQGSPIWSIGANYKVAAGATREVYPHFFNGLGKVVTLFPAFHSTLIGNNRNITAYLPPSYDENTSATYPVLYMHDGQNLFDGGQAFGGNEWKVDETLNDGIYTGSLREIIVIGIANTSDRMSEYTPTKDASYGGGEGDEYLTFIRDELMPAVQNALRVQTGREATGLLGSSLGGLISAYAGVHYGQTFGIVGAMSPSTWWNKKFLIGDVKANPQTGNKRPLRVYVDSGDAGPSNDDVTNTATLAQTYKAQGFVEGQDFHYVVGSKHEHNEYYWAQRLPNALKFLFPE
ncbi:MAG: alpha/beta hydrolase [Deltaproteobacteria bacterium]|nr:alpha/beta hydrolase [Deltaproteobacteria bacterium]